MICEKCGLRESTGTLINLCDDCFDEWEEKVQAQGCMTTDDLKPIDPAMKYQSVGGLIPDYVKGVRLRGTGGDVRIDWTS